ncbi:hypothetical protein MASSI9I_51374 [Massilia sp. 9I]|nr:hypothetical protein MASSI9I_51374 [Massilia sp. 9I]
MLGVKREGRAMARINLTSVRNIRIQQEVSLWKFYQRPRRQPPTMSVSRLRPTARSRLCSRARPGPCATPASSHASSPPWWSRPCTSAARRRCRS